MDIAVIDIGIEEELISKKIKIHSLNKHNNYEKNVNKLHATYVINTISKYSDYLIDVFFFDIINSEYNNSSIAVIEALRKISQYSNIKIIVVALTVIDKSYFDELESVCRLVASKGKLIVAASSNSTTAKYSYPADFDCVLGVKKAGFLYKNKYVYNDENKFNILGDVLPEFINMNNGRHVYFAGTSKATAKIIPIIIKAYETVNNGIEGVKKYLKDNSSNLNEDLLEVIKTDSLKKYNLYIDELNEFNDYLSGASVFIEDLDQLIRKKNYVIRDTLIKRGYIDIVLKNYFRYKNLNINLEEMCISDFMTGYDIANYIGRRVEREKASRNKSNI